MSSPDLTADLPAPRDDEPASLRADIVDELADHLQCAVRREELRSDSEPWGSAPRNEGNGGGAEPRRSQVYQRVLARFGDPAAVARKLWWDHMRERIMGQRILTGLTALAVVACCAMAVLMWQMLGQMQNAQRDMLAESQAQNARLLEQFQAMIGEWKAGTASDAPSEWVPVTVKCTFDTEDGPPAAGVKVDLRGETERTVGLGGEKTTDASGVVDFGKVLYGQYRCSCEMPNGMRTFLTVFTQPGQVEVINVVCPSAPPESAGVEFNFQPPEDLQRADVYYIAVVESAVHIVNDLLGWRVPSSSSAMPCYLLGPDGALRGEVDAELADALRNRTMRQGRRNNDSELSDRLQSIQVSPVAQRPGYIFSGQMLALLPIQGDESTVNTEAALPALQIITRGSSSSATFHMNPATRTINLSDPEQFWKETDGWFSIRARRGS